MPFVKKVGKVVALPARLLVDDTHTNTGFKGDNPVLAPRVGGSMPLVRVDLG